MEQRWDRRRLIFALGAQKAAATAAASFILLPHDEINHDNHDHDADAAATEHHGGNSHVEKRV